MPQPTAPQDLNGVNTGFGIWNNGGTATPAWPRMLAAAVVGSETTVSGALSVGGMVVHDAADTATIGPIKMGGYAKATAPSVVSADADIVNAWLTLRGEQAVSLTQAGVFIGIADDAAFTPATSVVIPAGFEADETGTDSVDEGDAGAARMTLDRKVIVTPQPHTAGGLDTFAATSQDSGTALTNSAQAIKASAGQLYGWLIYNPNDEVSFVNVYNATSGSVTVGTTVPLFHFPVPAGAAANLSGAHGIAFGTAISASATKTAGSNTAPDTALEAVFFYK